LLVLIFAYLGGCGWWRHTEDEVARPRYGAIDIGLGVTTDPDTFAEVTLRAHKRSGDAGVVAAGSLMSRFADPYNGFIIDSLLPGVYDLSLRFVVVDSQTDSVRMVLDPAIGIMNIRVAADSASSQSFLYRLTPIRPPRLDPINSIPVDTTMEWSGDIWSLHPQFQYPPDGCVKFGCAG